MPVLCLIQAIFTEEMESIINSLPKQEAPFSDAFLGELYQTFKEEIITMP